MSDARCIFIRDVKSQFSADRADGSSTSGRGSSSRNTSASSGGRVTPMLLGQFRKIYCERARIKRNERPNRPCVRCTRELFVPLRSPAFRDWSLARTVSCSCRKIYRLSTEIRAVRYCVRWPTVLFILSRIMVNFAMFCFVLN